MKELDEQHLSLVLTQQDKNRSKQIDLFKKANSTSFPQDAIANDANAIH